MTFPTVPTVLTVLTVLTVPTVLTAQTPRLLPLLPVGNDSVVIAADSSQAAGALFKSLFGRHYRDLWAAPIQVPVLDLQRFDGGLTPTEKGGGKQTRTLEFESKNGREWVFRSVAKDARGILPERFQESSFLVGVVNDQTSHAHPGGALIIPPLAEAVGVLHVKPQFAVMPDHAALGEFREEFAGMLGQIEQLPDDGKDERPGFAGSPKVVNSEDLLKALNEDPSVRVDPRAFLTARLLDFVINDWDRHHGNWRWAQLERDGSRWWMPIPRDRDQALLWFDGLLPGLARRMAPQLLLLGPEIDLKGLTINGRELDRNVLAGLERAAWDSVARFVTSRLTDSVIDAAEQRLPPRYLELRPGELSGILKARRDRLEAAATAWYDQLALVVDVPATDARDVAVLERGSDGSVQLSLHDGREGKVEREPWLRRRFLPAETREIRLHLHGGDDSLAVDGPPGPLVVRVIGGKGDNSTAGAEGIRLYDFDEEPVDLTYGADTLYLRRPQLVFGDDTLIPPPDHGSGMTPAVNFRYASDLGLVSGVHIGLLGYGFRKYPYARRISFGVDLASGPGDARADLGVDFRREGGGLHPVFRAYASGLELMRYYGQGNETSRDLDGEFFRLEHSQYGAELMLARDIGRFGWIEVGPALLYARTGLDPARFIGQNAPYGSGEFGQAGARARLRLRRDDDLVERPRGIELELSGSAWPAIWDAAEPYGSIDGRVTVHLSAGTLFRPTLALRAGGRKLFGDYPFFASAFLGGRRTLRGYDEQRFAGSGMAYGNAELRLAVLPVPFFMAGHLGVHGLADVGRVWAEGESSDTWHDAFGGGFWYGVDSRSMLISVTLADGPERTGVYIEAGFAF